MTHSNWQDILANSNINIQDILNKICLEIDSFYDTPINIDNFSLRVTPSLLNKIKPGDPNDPILKQILPTKSELLQHDSYYYDPLLEKNVNPEPSIIHKFYGRALITMSGNCPIHCRYCFRKNFDYQANLPTRKNWTKIEKYLSQHSDIFEVILSGGDPLINNDKFLGSFIQMVTKIPNISTVRIHSRVPVVLPERITSELLDVLSSFKIEKVLIIHTNHPQELDNQVRLAIQSLKEIGFVVFNQSVFLKGVNNDSNTLIELSKKLFSYGIMPYYLHLLDRVSGSQKFFVKDPEAIKIHQTLLKKLPGYLVPKLVREKPGAPYKVPIF